MVLNGSRDRTCWARCAEKPSYHVSGIVLDNLVFRQRLTLDLVENITGCLSALILSLRLGYGFAVGGRFDTHLLQLLSAQTRPPVEKLLAGDISSKPRWNSHR